MHIKTINALVKTKTMNLDELIKIVDKRKPLTTVGKPRSNWREKVYPKPKIWVSKETLKYIKNEKTT